MRTAANNYASTTMATSLAAAGAAVTVNDGSVFPSDHPFYVVADINSPTNREVMLISSRSGNDLTIGARYLQGSAAPSGIAHSPGVTLGNYVLGQYIDGIWEALEAIASAYAQGTLANRPAADGAQGVYRTTDGEGTFIDIEGTWYRLLTEEGGALNPGVALRVGNLNDDFRILGRADSNTLDVMDADLGTGMRLRGLSSAVRPRSVDFLVDSNEKVRIGAAVEFVNTDVTGGNLYSVFDKVSYDGSGLNPGTHTLTWGSYAVAYRVFNAGSHTVAFTWPTVASTQMYTVQLNMLVGTTVPTITWPAEVTWADGVIPTLTASRVHQFVFQRLTINGSVRTWGSLSGVRSF